MNKSYPNTETIKEALHTEVFGRQILCVRETESTNTLAKAIAREKDCHGMLVICENQTCGKGRRGRTWLSDKDSSLCMSIVLQPDIASDIFPRYAIAAAVAVHRAIKAIGIDTAQIKWPNDILANGKKLCGILMGGDFFGNTCVSIICGIGINVENAPDADKIDNIATSIYNETGNHICREHLCANILNEAEKTFALCESNEAYNELIHEYCLASAVLGKCVTIKADEDIVGTVLGFDSLGRIIIEDNGKKNVFDSGDVSLRC